MTPLTKILRKHWGYSSFRARQEDAIRAILGGRDLAAVMPTGAGKSLCYQLPAVALNRTAIVVSPLIALMQDQVAHLERMGIPAGFLNSTQDWPAQERVRARAERGELRLLYLAPERLVRDDTLEWLRRLPIAFFAVDEAHCISEWGHEFRKEYRQLKRLRDLFPDLPIAAFTASATRHVRHDIVAQLGLRDPAKIALSFQRPNLRYAVRNTRAADQLPLLKRAAEAYAGKPVIVYCGTIAEVESTAAALNAALYHGKLDPESRERNQAAWMRGEKPWIVGTLAFGLGINKPDVRAVIHLALPKSLEQYYQEAGRAGRDGEPADCVLLWKNQDKALLAHFNEQIEDPDERERGWQRYHTMIRYTAAGRCRQRHICEHFGESPKWSKCGACDVCAAPPDWLTAPKRSTSKKSRPSPAPKPGSEPTPTPAEAASPLDSKLRAWRLDLARQSGKPAFTVLHDRVLAEIARRSPATLDEVAAIPGIGPAKLAQYGEAILRIIAES